MVGSLGGGGRCVRFQGVLFWDGVCGDTGGDHLSTFSFGGDDGEPGVDIGSPSILD